MMSMLPELLCFCVHLPQSAGRLYTTCCAFIIQAGVMSVMS